MKASKPFRGLKRWAAGLLLAVFLAWTSLFAYIALKGREVDLRRSDCIMVLGARSLADGTPGPSLRARLERAAELFHRGLAPAIVCTGGKGQSGTVESEVSRRYLLSRGVPSAAIYCEDQSHNTRENFVFAVPIFRQHGWKNCLLVTDPFHQPRSRALAQEFGIRAYPAPSLEGPANRRWGSWLYYMVRETLSWLKFCWQRSRAQDGFAPAG